MQGKYVQMLGTVKRWSCSKLLHADVPQGNNRMQECVRCYKCCLCASHETIPQKGNDSLIISEGRGESLCCGQSGKCRAQSCPTPLVYKAMQ